MSNGDYGFWARLAFYVCSVIVLAALGSGLLCGVALLDQMHGLTIQWPEVVAKGAEVGAIGGGIGSLLVFLP